MLATVGVVGARLGDAVGEVVGEPVGKTVGGVGVVGLNVGDLNTTYKVTALNCKEIDEGTK